MKKKIFTNNDKTIMSENDSYIPEECEPTKLDWLINLYSVALLLLYASFSLAYGYIVQLEHTSSLYLSFIISTLGFCGAWHSVYGTRLGYRNLFSFIVGAFSLITSMAGMLSLMFYQFTLFLKNI